MDKLCSDVLDLAESYIENKYSMTLASLASYYSTSDIMAIISEDQEVYDALSINYCREAIYYYIKQIKFSSLEKIIPRIYNKDIFLAIHPEVTTIVSDSEMKLVFRAMQNNLSLYEKLYENKTRQITDTLNQKVYTTITSAKLFHLFGLNFRDWQKKYRKEILELFPELRKLLNESYINLCASNDPRLYSALKLILNNEVKIINSIKNDDNVAKAFPIPKMKVKAFAFERLGIQESPAGIIHYNKDKDPKGQKSMISSDFFILRDFSMDYQLKWILNGYNSYGKLIKNAETLLIEEDNSTKFKNQLISISRNIKTINNSSFDYNVLVIEDETDFSGDGIQSMAIKLMDGFPEADLTHLQELVSINQKVMKKTK